MTKKDFRLLYNLILQYAYLAPLLTFAQMLRTYEGSDIALWIIKILKLLSAMICFYGLFALLRASSEILKQFNIHGKFWCIKGLIVILILPPFIIGIINVLPQQNSSYDHDTMVEAYGAIIAIFCFNLLSILFLKYFKPEDALNAMNNQKKRDHTASSKFIMINQNDIDHDIATSGITPKRDEEIALTPHKH